MPNSERKPVKHVLKTLPGPWDAIEAGLKRFEVRRNDRFFQSGDIVVLRKLSDLHVGYATRGGKFEYCDLRFRIGWILQGGQFGIESGYCVFQLEPSDAL